MMYSRSAGMLLLVIDDTRRVWSAVGVQGGGLIQHWRAVQGFTDGAGLVCGGDARVKAVCVHVCVCACWGLVLADWGTVCVCRFSCEQGWFTAGR